MGKGAKRTNRRRHYTDDESLRRDMRAGLSPEQQEEYDAIAPLCMVKPQQFPSNMSKYYRHRHSLFSLYDQGCLLDEQSWYSVTPECVAYRIARRCATDGIVLDLFAGAGGNAIQFAFTCARVVAVEIDPLKVKLAKWNAQVYGVADRIEFIQADAIQVMHDLIQLKKFTDDSAKVHGLSKKDVDAIEVVFLSPPWGGIDYIPRQTTVPFTQSETEVDEQTALQSPPSSPPPQATPSSLFYSLTSILPVPGRELFQLCVGLTSNIAYYLPRNTDMNELAALRALTPDPDAQIKVEEQWINRAKLSSITAYFGQLSSGWDDVLDDWKQPVTI